VNGYDKHNALIPVYESILEELNPVLKADKEKDRAIQDLREQVSELKQLLIDLTGNNKTD
jgi:archaellum component FlaC